MPSRALAIASTRRATRASDFLLASLRSTTGDRSLRIHSAVILPSSNQSEGNHEPDPLGIAPRQQESSLSTPGITLRVRLELSSASTLPRSTIPGFNGNAIRNCGTVLANSLELAFSHSIGPLADSRKTFGHMKV